ncbi:alpha-ketoglutarate-dependent dioxygenase AlkB [Tsuneonella amylolytica]|uniref:alpha-ketoglutarate-dependent dioxygenase AlkB n=1 Tax=Tsuneonella amylolytica TaxID=2338327 RepID=UPI000EAA071B|nr:alpha-ketoglutarate-dependent dioxygenase AlkB [Tsuneonella amylolytica]
MSVQPSLFDPDPAVPGLSFVPHAIGPEGERACAARIDAAPLEPFKFGQWEGKRLTAHYGSAYDYQRGRTIPAPPLPDWLTALRADLAAALGVETEPFVQALLIRYDPGAGIGWHRDRPQYGQVMGLSLGAPAVLRLRRRRADGGFDRRSVELPPRSVYLLDGEVRHEWEHSIAPMDALRRSITFRTLRVPGR